MPEVKFCDETYIALARVLVFYRNGQIIATGEGAANMRNLRRRFGELCQAKTEDQIDLYLDGFDPEKKAEDLARTFAGDGKRRVWA